ncbi:NADH-quinone oxidoreductase subunit NuoE [Peptococcaceae bacterium 1198_IL3148]
MSVCSCRCGNNTDANHKALKAALDKYKDSQGALIPLLQEAQDIYGYLPQNVMEQIAKALRIPLSKVYGVTTFYAQFHLKPRGRHVIRVCTGTACHVQGADKVLKGIEEALGIKNGETTDDLRYTLETVACLGACGLAPAMMVNEDTYGRLTSARAIAVLDQYK